MNSKEIIFANFEHRGKVRPGLNFENGRLDDLVLAFPAMPEGYTPRRWTELPYEYYDDVWGNVWHRTLDGSVAGEIFQPAISNWEKFIDYQTPNYNFDECVKHFRKALDNNEAKFKIAVMPGWIFATCRYLRKMEVYLMDMLLYPEELTKLHNHVATVYELFIRAAAKAGAHAIFFCEDMGSQKGLLFSPALWNQYFAELYAKLFSLAHDLNLKVIMHSCGKNSEILEPLLKAGVDCFQFDQPTLYDMGQLSALLRRYKAAIWSPIDIQKILPTGNTEIIANGVKDMLSNFGGFIIFKQYPDLKGIGVDEAWDNYAYNQIINNIRL